MTRWTPTELWKGEDAYIIGGGPSLHSFDWDLLRGKRTIGCNSAFILGSGVVDLVLFGDFDWWDKIGRERTNSYGGLVVGCSDKQALLSDRCPWLLTMMRHSKAELTPPGSDSLAWFGSTGAMAVNLALLLGAQRVFLLGFDMQRGAEGSPRENKANWHDVRYTPGRHEVYPLFLKGFSRLLVSLRKVYPGREVVNVTDNSRLDVFPKVSLEGHFTKEINR